MPPRKRNSRQRLIQAALKLFTAQGITETTTRQIAELAGVNEVTLFRQFGNKHGLLLAIVKEADLGNRLGVHLGLHQTNQSSSQALVTYVDQVLSVLDEMPAFVRSLVGEASHYSVETRQALGQCLDQVNQLTTQYLNQILSQSEGSSTLSPNTLARLTNSLILGYVIAELTSEIPTPWSDRQAFVEDWVQLLLAAVDIDTKEAEHGTMDQTFMDSVDSDGNTSDGGHSEQPCPETAVVDLPTNLVRTILQRAKNTHPQDYAMVYVLFGAGLNPSEVANLERSHSVIADQQHVLRVTTGAMRQVPLNQWILGKRYGSHKNNPLTQWLKNRQDDQPAVFGNELGSPISAAEVRLRWQALTANLATPTGSPPTVEQAQQTWCVDMLMRGVAPENLRLLTGWEMHQLQPYIYRAQQKTALAEATQLDQKHSSDA